MLQDEIIQLEREIKTLKDALTSKEGRLKALKIKKASKECVYSPKFTTEEITRYSRQIIMPQVTINGQAALKTSKVLIVGAGGLGCPAALYLAAAGIGELHIMDYDEVELTNLHRQILHTEADIGSSKSKSACEKLFRINSDITVVPIQAHANSTIIENIAKNKYDAVLDCTDNVPTRYLLNDVCVFHNVPLVSGSALQMEGQLTVYHYNQGPCYRCLFPVPPPPETVTNCGDGGVLGPIPGVIGVLQALEAIKILIKSAGVLSSYFLIFDGSETVFRKLKLRARVPSCEVCGENPKITGLIDYEQFCGAKSHDKVINIDMVAQDENIEATHLPDILKSKHLVIDVRPDLEYEMCNISNTINFPYDKMKGNEGLNDLDDIFKKSKSSNVYLLCRRGNDSQRSLKLLKEKFSNLPIKFINIKGGLYSYSKHVDSSFPIY